MVWGLGEVSRTGKLKRTFPTGVSVVIVQRMTPAVSRRMLSTPGSMSVKFVSFEKKLRTTGNGALISILSLNEDLMRNMVQWSVLRSQKSEVRSQKSEVRSQKSEVRSQKLTRHNSISSVLRAARSFFIPTSRAPAMTRLAFFQRIIGRRGQTLYNFAIFITKFIP